MFSFINTLKEHTRSTIWKLPHNSERLLLFRKHKMFKFICFLKCQLNMCIHSMNAFLKIPCCNDLKLFLVREITHRDRAQRGRLWPSTSCPTPRARRSTTVGVASPRTAYRTRSRTRTPSRPSKTTSVRDSP